MQKVFIWIKSNFKIMLSLVVSVAVALVAFMWQQKNKKIERMRYELNVQRAKWKVEKLVAKHDVTVEEIHTIRKNRKTLDDQLLKIEVSLRRTLPSEMSADEIIKKFKQVGIRPRGKNV